MQSPAIRADNLAHAPTADAAPLFTDLSVRLPREPQALVGRNGVGKSILARILAGHLTPDEGTVSFEGSVGYLTQHVISAPGETIADFLGLSAKLAALQRLLGGSAAPEDITIVGDDWTLAEDIAADLATARLDFPLTRKVVSLSGGERTRLALFRLMRGGADYLILDEPSNHLDQSNRHRLADQIAKWDRGCLIISHDPLLLRRVTVIHELSPLGLRSYGGGYDAYRTQKSLEQAKALQDLDEARKAARLTARQQQASREKLQQRQAQGKRLRTTGSQSKMLMDAQKARAEQTQSRLAQLGEQRHKDSRTRIAEAEALVERHDRLGFPVPHPEQCGDPVLALTDLILPFGNPTPISFTLERGDRLAVTGGNGRGKTTFLQVIRGLRPPKAGHSRLSGSIGILDQTGESIDPTASGLALLRQAHPSLRDAELRTRLATIGLRRERALQPFRSYSGGERMKLALLRLFAGKTAPSLLLLDEPDNHLDLDARQLLIDSLNQYRGAMILVTHSPDLIDDLGISQRLML